MQNTRDQWLLFFFLYCFLGWVWESLYVSFHRRKWVNRGFLYGPAIPMYGFGAVMNLMLTSAVGNSVPLTFLLGTLGSTVLEYATGVVMQRLFHARYWDYSRNRLNLNGYICPFCSFGWGLLSVAQIKMLHPLLESAILGIPLAVSAFMGTILVAVCAADTALSVRSSMPAHSFRVK